MDDLRDWSPEINGVVSEERLPSSSSSVLYSNQTGSDLELWQKAEEATREIISQIQPTIISEERRRAVIDYVQRLLRNYLGCEVFPFGSVPLKTYLPDGDIDLTIFGGLNCEEAIAKDLCSVLEIEEQNSAAEFVVKDVQFIPAEVKLVKCLVQNIVVDISFNRLGGLCTQCFLEQVDRLIGKDHLFKRSIILIKAWCYYESRILGAHHGLISTYALETLILYIFHVFHSSLNGPLEVLYKFLDYFSKFDWDNFCISLNGLIRLSTWPELVEAPGGGEADLLLSREFLKDCLEMYSDPCRGIENSLRTFPQKHLNIVDPLNESNNLGRSVSKGNFYRIRSAFSYGARKLQHILFQTEENIRNELRSFFPNTLDRHGSGQRPDVQGFIPMSRYSGLSATSSVPGTPSSQEEDQMVYNPDSANPSCMPVNCWPYHEDSSHNVMDMDYLGRKTSKRNTFVEPQNSGGESAVSENHLSGFAEDIATSSIQGLAISGNTLKSSSPNAQGSNSLSVKVPHAPKPYYSSLSMGKVEMSNGHGRWKSTENSSFAEKKEFSSALPSGQEKDFSGQGDQVRNKSTVNQNAILRGSRHHPLPVKSTGPLEDLHSGSLDNPSSTSLSGNYEASSSLADLCGDYDSHLHSLHYGRWCCETFLNAPVSPMSTPMQFRRKNSWDVVRPFRQNLPVNANGVVSPRPMFPPVKPPFLHGAGFAIDETPKQRGTGTYFPNMRHYKDLPLQATGRNQAPLNSPRNNGHVMPFRETNSPERSSHEAPQVYPNARQGGGRFGSVDLRHSASAENINHSYGNGSLQHTDRVEEFGSSVHVQSKPPAPESTKQLNPASPQTQNSSTVFSTPGTENPDRTSIKSYHLKDDDDFPPLSA